MGATKFKQQQIVNPYKARAYRNTSAQAVSATTLTKVQFNAENFDTNNNFDSTTNYRYVAPVDGYYAVNVKVRTAVVGNTRFRLAINKNGAEYSYNDLDLGSGSFNSVSLPLSDIMYLVANDYIEAVFYSNQATSITNGEGNSYISIHLISI